MSTILNACKVTKGLIKRSKELQKNIPGIIINDKWYAHKPSVQLAKEAASEAVIACKLVIPQLDKNSKRLNYYVNALHKNQDFLAEARRQEY